MSMDRRDDKFTILRAERWMRFEALDEAGQIIMYLKALKVGRPAILSERVQRYSSSAPEPVSVFSYLAAPKKVGRVSRGNYAPAASE